MKSQTIISVILPVYNAENTIERAIQSILYQSFVHFELIIVNDGSSDNSKEIINDLARKDDRVKVFNLPHSGISKALNFGIKVSKGIYIARMDADDYSYQERLSKQYDYLESHLEVGLVSCLISHKGNNKNGMGYQNYVNFINSLIKPNEIYLKRFQESPFAHPSVCFRKSLVMKYGSYSERPGPEDFELWLRWIDQGVKTAKINQILLDWYDSPYRLSRAAPNYDQDKFFDVKSVYLIKWLNLQFTDHLPPIIVWGAGRIVNKRLRPLKNLGLKISQYIDVKFNDNRRFIHYSELPDPGSAFILCYVSDRSGKVKIFEHLLSKGYREGIHFLMMA